MWLCSWTQGVISGREVPVGSGLWFFKGTENVLRRAQFAKMVMEATGLHTPEVDQSRRPRFKDVHPTYDQGGSLRSTPTTMSKRRPPSASSAGYSDGLFRPYTPITRSQLVLMIIAGRRRGRRRFRLYEGSEKSVRRRAPLAPALPRDHDRLSGRDPERQPGFRRASGTSIPTRRPAGAMWPR